MFITSTHSLRCNFSHVISCQGKRYVKRDDERLVTRQNNFQSNPRSISGQSYHSQNLEMQSGKVYAYLKIHCFIQCVLLGHLVFLMKLPESNLISVHFQIFTLI